MRTEKIEFTPEMDLQVDTRHGPILVRWSASAWQDRVRFSVSLEAPFLLTQLTVGEAGFGHLSNILNEILNSEDIDELAEILNLIALSGAPTHWLKLLAKKSREEILTCLRKKNAHLEEYRSLAWSLKRKGYAVVKETLLLFGEQHPSGQVYLLDRQGRVIDFGHLDLQVIKAMVTSPGAKECQQGKWLLADDETAKKNLLRAAAETKEKWVEGAVTRLAAFVLEKSVAP